MSNGFNEIGARLKKVRKALNLTQKQIVAAVGLSTGYISELESGKQKSSPKLFYHLANEHRVNINYILTGKGGMFADDDSPGNIDRFGKDKEVVKEMLTFMLKSDYWLYGILSSFSKMKEEHPDLLPK